MVGGAGFVVDEAILTLGHYGLGLDPLVARAISILCAMTFTWWGNRIFTFAEHAANESAGAILGEWFKFVLANALGAVVNYGTFTVLVRFAPAPLSNPLLATAIGVGVGLIFNFTLSKRFVFRPK
ncbi:MAG: GtrA family protein [Alphaproteobacteria bacterium]|nr:GtrA family protein [Alphaproteobacteria bacterium]MBL6940178.1 GtrA family protein [Alphaproteobacteria bacterium]MBL7100265.1 GtrA family protein [Alphaproteobacteria bacterium]